MKNKLFLLAFMMLATCVVSSAQNEMYASTSKNIHVYVTKLSQSVNTVNEFLELNKASIQKTNYTIYNYTSSFSMNVAYLPALDSLCNHIGYVTQNTYTTRNSKEQIANLQSRIRSLEYTLHLYKEKLVDSLRSSQSDNENIRKKYRETDYELTKLQIELNSLVNNTSDSFCFVTLEIHDELSTPNNSRVSFVNMPGIEYGILFPENPLKGTSASYYQGFTVKYMFTRGKSYFNLGAYKAQGVNNVSDSITINEMFLVNFGQDFYPRHFGRGKRKFLNLYTGYQLGGFIANRVNNKDAKFIPNVNLSIGLELFKSKHVLIDNKASYFLPLNDVNRNLRGVMYQASFSFVF